MNTIAGPLEVESLLRSAKALSLEIRFLEAAPARAAQRIELLEEELTADIEALYNPVSAELHDLDAQIVELQFRKARLTEPFEEEVQKLRDAFEAALKKLAVEASAKQKEAKEKRQSLADLLGLAWERDGVQTHEDGVGSMQVVVKRGIAVTDPKAAVATLQQYAPGGKLDRYVTPNDAALSLIGGLVNYDKAAPGELQSVREAMSEYEGFALELSFSARLRAPGAEAV